MKNHNLSHFILRAAAILAMLILSAALFVSSPSPAFAAGKLPDAHTITITVSRDKEKGEKAVTGGEATASGKLPDYHTITITITITVSWDKETGEKVVTGGGVVIGGGGSEQSVSTLPGRKQVNGCDFSKPKIVGMGKSGLEGLPKDFPMPPGIKKPWKYEVARGSLYAIGISTGWKDTVSFVRKALPAHGWCIIKETKEHEPHSNTDWVHLFFSNSDYCGWVSIGTTVSHAPTPTSMNIGMKKRTGGT